MNVLLGNASPAEKVEDNRTATGYRLEPLGIGETITRFGPFPTEGWTLREKVAAITSPDGGWKGHSLDDTPEWLASDNEAMAILLAEEWPDAEVIAWDDAVTRYEAKGGSL